MILPPLVYAPFHHSHRAELREIPDLQRSGGKAKPRLQLKTVLIIVLIAAALVDLLFR
jgi:hypothetical protein